MNVTLERHSFIKMDLYPLLKLAIPLILTGLAQSSLGFLETVFLSHLGETTMAAGSLVSWLFATLIVILFGTFSAVNILIALKHGAKDKAGIVLVLRDGLLLAILLTIPTFFLFWNVPSVLLLFGQSAELTALAKLYLHALAWGLFPKFILIVLFEMLLGLGHSRTMLMVTLLAIPLYIFLSFVLIFGKLGFPALGIAGAGWGMTIADWIITSILSLSLFFSKTYKSYLQAIFTMQKPSYLWEILHLGFPMGAMYCIEVGFFFVVALMMGVISIPALAANQIAMQYLGPLMGVIFCIAQAVTVRMGHQLGAKEVAIAKRTAFTGVLVSAFFMVIVAIFYCFIPSLLISVDFNVQNSKYVETIQLASGFLFIAAFFQIFEAVRITLFGALRALKDTHFTLLTSIISFWCIALPIGYVLAFTLTLGGKGLWMGMVIGAIFSMLLLYWRLQMKMHRYI